MDKDRPDESEEEGKEVLIALASGGRLQTPPNPDLRWTLSDRVEMMSEIRSFLDWFDGFAENLNKQPTPKQWQRVVERINQLRQFAPESTKEIPEAARRAAEEAQKMTASAKRDVSKPRTEKEWLQRYQDALGDLGVDPESAKDFADQMKQMGVDIARDPKEMAQLEYGGSVQ